jgi:hypothetical protein
MTNTGGPDLDQHLSGAWSLQINFDYLKGFSCSEGYGGSALHGWVSRLAG